MALADAKKRKKMMTKMKKQKIRKKTITKFMKETVDDSDCEAQTD
jgi:hypothetical protein